MQSLSALLHIGNVNLKLAVVVELKSERPGIVGFSGSHITTGSAVVHGFIVVRINQGD